MKPFNLKTDGRNKYVDNGLTLERCFEIVGDWRDSLPRPAVHVGVLQTIIDDSKTGLGTKGRWGDFLVSQVEQKELVYVQPRCGWAGISLSALAKKHGKKLTLFMPSSKQASEHQLVCIENGASPIFVRIAAMPNLNQIARAYALERDAYFIPFGLDHPSIVAAGVVSTLQHFPPTMWNPLSVWTVVSTGVLTRTLQIAWPEARFTGVAVARNLHDGEVGPAEMMSYHKPFTAVADLKHHSVTSTVTGALPYQTRVVETSVDAALNYDMKGLEYFLEDERPGLFWNVAGEIRPSALRAEDIDSQRDWGERK